MPGRSKEKTTNSKSYSTKSEDDSVSKEYKKVKDLKDSVVNDVREELDKQRKLKETALDVYSKSLYDDQSKKSTEEADKKKTHDSNKFVKSKNIFETIKKEKFK